MYRESVSIVQGDILFHGWPDGEGLLEQSNLTTMIFRIIKSEIQEVINDAIKRD